MLRVGEAGRRRTDGLLTSLLLLLWAAVPARCDIAQQYITTSTVLQDALTDLNWVGVANDNPYRGTWTNVNQNVRWDTAVVIEFAENVQVGSGYITMQPPVTSSTFGVSSASATTLTVPGSGVSVATNKLTINPSRLLIWSESTTYTVSFDAGVVINYLVPPDTNAAFSVQFTIGDFSSPIRVSVVPAQSSPAVDPTAGQTVTITFNEAIQVPPIGYANVWTIGLQDRYGRQTPVQKSYNCNDPAHVTISGATATIWWDPLDFQILPCQNYQLTYQVQCFWDVSPNKNPAAGLAALPPFWWWTSCITNYNPAANAIQISIATNIVLTFSEDIVAGTGNIVLTPLGETPVNFLVTDATRVLFNVPTARQITILGNVAPSYLCVGKTMQQCKGKPVDVQIAAGVINRVYTASPSPALVLSAALQAQLSGVPSAYRFTFKFADLTPPVMTIVSMYGISENVIRVTVRLDESGSTYCRAYPASTFNPVSQGGTSLPTLWDCPICTNRIYANTTGVVWNYFASAVYDPVRKYAEMPVDVANLTAKTFYWVYCFAMDFEIPNANVDTSSQMLATERYVRTLDTTPPSFSAFSCAPTALNENSITVTLSMNEAGRAYCKVVNGGFAMPSPNAVIAEGFYADVAGTASFTIAVNQITTGLGATGMEALLRKTRYDMYCWAQDAEGYPYSGPNGMASAVACPGNTVVTLDITRPNMRFIMAESISRSQIFITLQVDEGSKVWCAAWATDPGLTALNYETKIKSQTSQCMDNKGRTCGTWWIYDLVDIWDTAADGVATQSDYDATNIWHHNQDVDIIVYGLVEATAYPFIYCYAEDDETDGLGSNPNKMMFDNVGNVGPNNVYTIKTGIGTVTTLDESPPSFTRLAMLDPTALNDRIVVTFSLNEAGTAYCRVTRSDSGETTLKINRILTANYPGVVGAAGAIQSITVDKLQSTDTVGLYEATQYDVYCWAKDSAVDTQGQPRPNYQLQSYVDTPVGLTMTDANTAPQGGKTLRVWVKDTTPPVMIYVASEALTDTILQITLQLNEPGTVWCQAALPTASTTWLDSVDFTAGNYKSWIMGRSGLATYSQFVPQEFINVDVAMSKLETQLGTTAASLTSKTAYNIWCFAMDDWRFQAENAPVRSINFDPLNEGQPNEVTFATVSSLATRVGTITTLDLTPPSITITGVSSLETSITVTLRMDESGTAWCQAVRKGFSPPTILEILDTNFYNTYTYNSLSPTAVTTVVLTGYDRPKNAYPSYVTPLVLATRYDVYCYGEDVLCLGCKVTNGMSFANVQLTTIPIRTKDLTPPNMRFVAAESIAKDQIIITVQVDEGARVWCGAWTTDPLLTALNYQTIIKTYPSCQDNKGRACGSFWVYDLNDVQDAPIRAITNLADYQLASTWRYNEDVNIIVYGLIEKQSYPFIYCYAEDDENDGLGSSPNAMIYSTAVLNSGPNNVYTIQQAIGTVFTLDESPPSFTQLAMRDPTLANNQIVVTFQLNEAGTAYCRATRTDSGETSLKINQVLSAAYSTTVAAATVGYITVDKLESRDPSTATLFEASQYDVYCWAKDSAVDTQGLARPNYQRQSYLDTAVGNVNSPAGGKTQFVWVKDTTPPTVIFVAREALSETTIQITLQLNEPGTVWCHPAIPVADATYVDVTDITPATYIAYIKGRVASFYQWVPTAYTNVYVAVNQIDRDTGSTAAALIRATQYNIFCHAEDDWNAQAANAASLSINYNVANVPTSPPPSGNGNEITYASAVAVQTAIGIITTLNLTPPSITVSGISSLETSITVTVRLDTSGTIWCQAVRQNFNVPTILEILDTSFSNTYTYNSLSPTATTTVVVNGYDRPFNYNNAYVTPLVLGTRYDVYCYAEDVLCPGCKVTNGVTSANVALTKTQIRTKDLTPPNMRFVNAESIARDQIIVTIQVDEGALVWCAAWQTIPSPAFTTTLSAATAIKAQSANCKDGFGISCGVFWVYDLDMLIASQAAYSNWNSWKVNQDVDIIISGLTEKTPYAYIYCYAEDDETPANPMIFNSVASAGPSNVYTIQQAIGTVQTLDESPPSFTRLALQDPSAINNQLIVTLQLNEAGTAYCRTTRSDSGETTLRINQILTAGFSTYVASSAVTGYITIDKLESRDTANLFEASQYDVYCWAMDSAVDTQGLARPNYILQSYVDTAVGLTTTSPLGGKTRNVWVTDSTPPVIIVVAREAIAEDTIQVTLQLNEPGTIWCQVAQDVTALSGTYCRDQDVTSSTGVACAFEAWTKGTFRASGSTVFQAFVPIPYQDYDINMNFMEKIAAPTAGVSLVGVTNYWIWCFAEDDWVLQASYTTTYGALSTSFVAPTGPNKVSFATATSVKNTIGRVLTLDQTAPVFTAIAGAQFSETVLTMTVTLDTPATVWCMPVRQNFAQPSINEILQNNEYNAACGTTACTVTNQGLQPKTMYDIWCYCEDTNVYPQRPNGRMFTSGQKVTLSTLDTTPPILTIISAESPIRTDIRVKVKMDEPGTVWCNSFVRGTAYGSPDFSSISAAGYMAYVGLPLQTPGGPINTNVEVVVTSRVEQTAYDTYCTAQDTSTLPTVNRVLDPVAVTTAAAIGVITTLDQSPPTFTVLGASGTTENTIQVTFRCNEACSAYCRVTRSDSGETSLSVNRILKANFQASWASGGDQTININRLENDPTQGLLERSTLYDTYCWIQDTAVQWSCYAQGAGASCSTYPKPNYQSQVYVGTAFGGTPPATVRTPTLPLGGLMLHVRTPDLTPPTVIFVEAESTEETSITVTLQLDEPGTAFCKAFTATQTVNAALYTTLSTGTVYQNTVTNWNNVYRNFQVKVANLAMHTKYYVYCSGEDDEYVEGMYTIVPAPVADNKATAFLTEATGRWTLDLTPPIITVLAIYSTSETSATLDVRLDEPGTVWCQAVRSMFTPPTINQIIAASFSTYQGTGNVQFSVTVQNLVRDTEYDVYCHARDTGTTVGAGDPPAGNPGNDITYATVLTTKRDIHTMGDSTPPIVVTRSPVQAATNVAVSPVVTITFNEDIQAGSGLIIFTPSGGGGTINLDVANMNTGACAGAAQLSITLTTLKVDFTPCGSFLTSGVRWYISFAAGVIKDTSYAANPVPAFGTGQTVFFTTR